ncbi:EXS family protein/ERD1/XPR1/SYG1 family protein [Mycena crocata]|nr:EXS family protein/ERD1/XPR1/SYG1 family protein [Mycena crocata]
MKFTRYLEDTQTPEWKRAYIDYRIFKERIRAIRRAQDRMGLPIDSGLYSNSPRPGSMLSVIVQSESGDHSSGTSSIHLPIEKRDLTFVSTQRHTDGPSRHLPERRLSLPRTQTSQSNVTPPSPGGVPATTTNTGRNRPKITLPQLVVRQATNRSNLAPPSPAVDTATLNSRHAKRSPLLARQWTNSSQAREMALPSPAVAPSSPASRVVKGLSHIMDPLRRHPYSELSLNALIPLLSWQELAFFSALDSELQKVSTFYLDREKAMKTRTRDLEAQLRELNEHRKLFDATHPETSVSWATVLNPARVLNSVHRRLPFGSHRRQIVAETSWHGEAIAITIQDESGLKRDDEQRDGTGRVHEPLDPKEYLHARRKLKKAVLEHYRGLEMLHNYRVLNIYGFRRVLHKFEKATKIPAQRAYMEEKVDKSAFATDETLRAMMDEMQNIFAASFAEGDRKKAITRLRAGPQYKSHHNSTFCSGIAIGSALAAFGSGIAHCLQQSTRDAISGWDGLLFIYGVLAVPVLFALLVGLNLLVWTRARINYVFIFGNPIQTAPQPEQRLISSTELDVRTRLDSREFFQTPSYLMAALCYAFWLSFSRIGAPTISPTVWPLIWLAFAAAVLFDPLPILFKPARYWLIRNVGKLLKSGTKRVEARNLLLHILFYFSLNGDHQFTDFWMGDQFCSLVFTLSNLPLIGCVYSQGLDADWRKCGNVSRFWPLSFVLGVLPFLVRLIQSIKRYADSRLTTHLINAGKYGAGIVSYLCYFIWRHHGGHYDSAFALWCIFNTISTTYALIWDFLMDWSILRLHSRYFLLRQELVYRNHIYLYYVAIATNTLIRFLWVLYIPAKGPDVMLRSFIVGLLEIVRRWQWNFYRLENEHVGNVDQYRVTKDVPLPYNLYVRGDLEEDGIPETPAMAL